MHALEKSNDNIIAILGKGMEEYQLIKGQKIPHSDIKIVEKYIDENTN